MRLLGPLQISTGGRSIETFLGRKAQAILAYLATVPGHCASRDRIAHLLWGERFDDHARQSLRQTLTGLRRVLDDAVPGVLATDRASVALSRDLLSTDLDDYERLAGGEDAASLQAATELLRGEFLDGLEIPSPAWEEWLSGTRRDRRALTVQLLTRLLRKLVDAGDAPSALVTAARLDELEPLDERAHRLTLEAVARFGSVAAALQSHRAFSERLRRDLGVAPDPETTRFVEELGVAYRPAAATTDIRPRGVTTAAEVAAPMRRRRLLLAACGAGVIGGTVAATALTATVRQRDSKGALAEPAPLRWPFRFFVRESRAGDGDASVRRLAAALQEELRASLAVMPSSALTDNAPQADFTVESDVRVGDGERPVINLRVLDQRTGLVLWADTMASSEHYAGGFPSQRTAPVETAIARAYAALLVEMDRRREPAQPPSEEVAGHIREGWAALRGGATRAKVDASTEAFQMALAIDPASADARLGIAHSHAMYLVNGWSERRAEEAVAAQRLIAETIERSARQPIAFFVLGLVHKAQRDYARALAALRVTLQIQPTHAPSYAQSAHMYLLSGNAERAVELAELGVRLGPSANALDRALLYAGMARLLNGDVVSAVVHLERSFTINQTFSDVFAWLAVALHMSGQTERALEVYRAMRGRWPNARYDHHVLIAHAPERMQQFSRSFDELEAFARTGP